nr:heparin lyase I family protein [Kineosphaera limosa]
MLAATLALAACSSDPAPTDTTTDSTAGSASGDPTDQGDDGGHGAAPGAASELTVGVREGQNGALKPWWTGTSVQAEVPAGLDSAERYRSEFFWNSPGGPQIRVGEGDRLRCRLQLAPHLGSAGQDSEVWQVVWQLHGPQQDGSWPQPPLNLHVRGGTWRIGGGAGRAGGQAAYHRPFPEFVEGQAVTWDLDVLVSSDPATARVDAWLDGRHVVADWRPPSGTRYPGQQWLTMKSGLYTGVDEGSEPPTQRRFVSIQPLACDITRANPATTAATSPASPDATTESGSAS